ncbi:MAG: YceI family protein [Candidatus Kapaibacterium sp.]|nr:MAG: YceI family protein [Candidatus Kapabacteria bacterium]
MKIFVKISATLVVGAVLGANTLFATGFNLSAKGTKTVTVSNKVGNSIASFSSKAPLEEITGNASGIKGSFTIDPANIEATTGKIEVAITSFQTGIELRDQHLRGKDWLDADAHPSIVFEIKKISGVQLVSSAAPKGIAKGMAEGTLTVHGVTKAVSFPIEIQYLEKSPADVVMVKSDFSVSLKEHNIAGKKGIVGSKVAETINVKVSLFGSTGA